MNKLTLPLLAGLALSASSAFAANVNLNGNVGKYTMTTGNTYFIGDNVTGTLIAANGASISIRKQSGKNGKLIGVNGANGQTSHLRVGNNATANIQGITVQNADQFAIGCDGGLNCVITSSATISPDHGATENGINGGEGGRVSLCNSDAGDDVFQMVRPDSQYSNCNATLAGNGAGYQFGWGRSTLGAGCSATDCTMSGFTTPNTTQGNTGNNPGRAVVGGTFEGSTLPSGSITGLTINGNDYAHIVKLRALAGKQGNNITIRGTMSVRARNALSTHTAVALSTDSNANSKLDKTTIDFGTGSTGLKSNLVFTTGKVTNSNIVLAP